MSFPAGEQFFINSVRAAQKVLPPEKCAALETEIRGFVGQEAMHRRRTAAGNDVALALRRGKRAPGHRFRRLPCTWWR
ncbi:MAG: metal-dependent hydrolase [Burkholderiaceae bacterium]